MEGASHVPRSDPVALLRMAVAQVRSQLTWGSGNKYQEEGRKRDLQSEEGQDQAPSPVQGGGEDDSEVWSLRDWEGDGAINRNREVRRRSRFRARR